MRRRVVVTGRGIISPLGVGIEEHQERLLAAETVIGKSQRVSLLGISLCGAGEVPEGALKKAASLIPVKQRKLMNPAGVFASVASSLAVEEAGLGEGAVDPSRLGVFLGTWFAFYHDLASFIRFLGESESEGHPRVMDSERANIKCLESMNPVDYSIKVLPNLTAGHLAILHRAEGASRVIADGWRGGLLAVAQAFQAIRYGELDVALAGGAEAPLEGGNLCEISTLECLAPEREGDGGVCGPFDAHRSGSVLGEGAGMVVLEERDRALARGASIYGEIVGSGCSAPGEGGRREESLAFSIKSALLDSGLGAEEIDLIHANGDSTIENDRAEWRAVKSVFGSLTESIPVTATKSLHGHLLSGAGGVELISSLIMLERGVVVPIANCDSPDPECELLLIRDVGCSKPDMRTALIHAFGLFGEGASLVVRR